MKLGSYVFEIKGTECLRNYLLLIERQPYVRKIENLLHYRFKLMWIIKKLFQWIIF